MRVCAVIRSPSLRVLPLPVECHKDNGSVKRIRRCDAAHFGLLVQMNPRYAREEGRSMDARREELDAFKKEISLTELMAAFGYRCDRKSSSRNSAAMVHADGDKLIVSRTDEGTWVFFSVQNSSDNGTVIEFLQRRTGENLGQIRRRLRDWMVAARHRDWRRTNAGAEAPLLKPLTRDLVGVRERFEQACPIQGYNRYLVEERSIPPEILSLTSFRNTIRVDARENLLFPHVAGSEITGYEIRGMRFKGFAKGGIKGLWTSHDSDYVSRLAVTESALDALAYASVVGHVRTRFVSIAGQLNRVQPNLLVTEIQHLPKDGIVVLAMDNDEPGDRLAERLTDIFERANRSDLCLRIHRPPLRGADWNDVARMNKGNPQPKLGPS